MSRTLHRLLLLISMITLVPLKFWRVAVEAVWEAASRREVIAVAVVAAVARTAAVAVARTVGVAVVRIVVVVVDLPTVRPPLCVP